MNRLTFAPAAKRTLLCQPQELPVPYVMSTTAPSVLEIIPALTAPPPMSHSKAIASYAISLTANSAVLITNVQSVSLAIALVTLAIHVSSVEFHNVKPALRLTSVRPAETNSLSAQWAHVSLVTYQTVIYVLATIFAKTAETCTHFLPIAPSASTATLPIVTRAQPI